MLADLVYERCKWNEDTKLLDFGCGRLGRIATALCQHTSHTVAVDANIEAVTAFNSWCNMQGLDSDEISVLAIDEFLAMSRFRNYFDIVVASLVFHHIDEIDREDTAATLRQRMRPGGRFVLVDVLKQNQADDTINGFTQQGLENLLTRAGFTRVSVELGPRITLHSQKRTRILVATASCN